MGKLPSFQFYPGDWLRDTVSGCSLAGQGLWLRLMIQMHDSERYGYLGVDGKPLPDEVLARRCGCSVNEYRGLLEELERAGVLGRTAEGIIFSRRMVRDAKAREAAADRQRKHRHGPVTPLSQPSSSSSSSSKHTLAPSAPGVCDDLLVFWNREHGPLPKILELTAKRREKIRARIRSDPDFAEKFKASVTKARQTPFLCGSGKRGWRASFDWLIANDTNVVAVLEGRYDDAQGPKPAASIPPPRSVSSELTDEEAKQLEARHGLVR